MSEQKRVSLTSISSTVSSSAAASLTASSAAAAWQRLGNDFRRPDKPVSSGIETGAGERRGVDKSIRLKMELFQTDSCSYPEFNYSKLMHLEKKKLKKLKQKTNGFSADPFEVKDDDVARIAKEFEKKYGSAYGSGRGRSKKDDHCDIGLGYDETDSFIDNTEAYDEIIPEEVETLEGGFYINCGALEFKKLSTEPIKTRTDEIIKMPNRPKKRVLSTSSSEDSSSSDGKEDDDDDAEAGDEESSGLKAEVGGKNKSAGPVEKRHKASNNNNPTKNKPAQQNGSGKKQLKPAAGFSGSSSNSPKPVQDELNSDSDRERVRQQKTVKTTTVKDMLKAKRDNFLKMQVGGEAKNLNGELKGAASKSSEDEDSSSEDSDSSGKSDSNPAAKQEKKVKKSVSNTATNEENTEKLRSADTKLPEMEVEVTASIHEFRELVRSKSMTGKRFQFDDKLTEMFLKVDESLLCLDKTQRNMVFAHLEFHLLLPKYYFLRKAKQLRIKEEKLKSKRALAKLRKGVIEAMPGAIANYEVELRKAAESQSVNLSLDQPPKMPKKKFPWTSDLRNILYEVYQVRWTSYPVLGTRKETLEDFINGYMRDKVVELWPNGWMRYDELQKEIERRKTAAKKAKPKKKTSSPNPTTVVTSNAAAAGSANQVANTVTTNAGVMGASNLYMKQFEEFASSSRSCANSDTDSVASSSGTSGGLKRRKADAAAGTAPKQGKAKSQKTNVPSGELPLVVSMSEAVNRKSQLAPTTIALPQELISPSKRTDHSIHSIISAAIAATLNTATMSTPSATAPLVSCSQSPAQQKHSAMSRSAAPPAHVIDLDNYKSTNDILQTSKQLLHAAGGHTSAATDIKGRSSSESDGVEIVGVFQAGLAPPPVSVSSCSTVPGGGKQKYGKKNAGNAQSNRSVTPSSTITGITGNTGFHLDSNINMYVPAAGAVPKVSSCSSTINNINPTPSNSKRAAANVLPEFDVTQVVKVLKGLEDVEKQKATATSRSAAGKESHHQ